MNRYVRTSVLGASLLLGLQGFSYAQTTPGGGGGGQQDQNGGGGGPGRQRMDPRQMRDRMINQLEQPLGMNDTDFAAVKPLIVAVLEARRDVNVPRFGPGGPGGGPGGPGGGNGGGPGGGMGGGPQDQGGPGGGAQDQNGGSLGLGGPGQDQGGGGGPPGGGPQNDQGGPGGPGGGPGGPNDQGGPGGPNDQGGPGGPGGQGGPGGRPQSAVQEALSDLNKTLDTQDSAADAVKSKLDAFRAAKATAKDKLTKAEAALQQVVTPRQEAVLVAKGVLD